MPCWRGRNVTIKLIEARNVEGLLIIEIILFEFVHEGDFRILDWKARKNTSDRLENNSTLDR